MISVRESIRDAIAEEMRSDSNVFLIGEEVGEYEGAYKVSQGLLEEFGPKRIIDTPITEAGFTGLAVGAAGVAFPGSAGFDPADGAAEAASSAAFLSAGVWPENCLVGENSPSL